MAVDLLLSADLGSVAAISYAGLPDAATLYLGLLLRQFNRQSRGETVQQIAQKTLN